MSPILRHPTTGERVNASHAGAAVLRERGYTDIGHGTAEATAPVEIDAMTGKELDAYAAELGIADWNAKAKVPDKKAALKAHLDAQTTEPDPILLEDATDEQLREFAEENGVEFDDDTTREDLIAALRA